MKYRIIIRTLGWLLLFEAIFFIVPLITAAVYWEEEFFTFLFTALLCGLLGGACVSVKAKKESLKDKCKELSDEIEKLKNEIKERDEKYLRMAAEYDNFRRRSKEERDACYENAVADTVAELLPIIDNLERATMYSDAEKVKEGLVMIENSVKGQLDKLGVSTMGCAGETFDPKYHNAVMHVEDEEHGEGEIVEVFQKGYKKGDKIIRFAMVKTAN